MTTLQALSLRQPIQPAPESTPTASNLTPDRITVLFSETVPGRTNDIVLFRKWFSPEPPLSLHEYLEVVILPKIDSNIDDYPRYAADIRAVFRGIGSDNGIVKLKMILMNWMEKHLNNPIFKEKYFTPFIDHLFFENISIDSPSREVRILLGDFLGKLYLVHNIKVEHRNLKLILEAFFNLLDNSINPPRFAYDVNWYEEGFLTACFDHAMQKNDKIRRKSILRYILRSNLEEILFPIWHIRFIHKDPITLKEGDSTFTINRFLLCMVSDPFAAWIEGSMQSTVQDGVYLLNDCEGLLPTCNLLFSGIKPILSEDIYSVIIFANQWGLLITFNIILKIIQDLLTGKRDEKVEIPPLLKSLTIMRRFCDEDLWKNVEKMLGKTLCEDSEYETLVGEAKNDLCIVEIPRSMPIENQKNLLTTCLAIEHLYLPSNITKHVIQLLPLLSKLHSLEFSFTDENIEMYKCLLIEIQKFPSLKSFVISYHTDKNSFILQETILSDLLNFPLESIQVKCPPKLFGGLVITNWVDMPPMATLTHLSIDFAPGYTQERPMQGNTLYEKFRTFAVYLGKCAKLTSLEFSFSSDENTRNYINCLFDHCPSLNTLSITFRNSSFTKTISRKTYNELKNAHSI